MTSCEMAANGLLHQHHPRLREHLVSLNAGRDDQELRLLDIKDINLMGIKLRNLKPLSFLLVFPTVTMQLFHLVVPRCLKVVLSQEVCSHVLGHSSHVSHCATVF